MQQSNPLINRPHLVRRVFQFLEEAPVTVLLGARQTGKTTLSRMITDTIEKKGVRRVHRFDLEQAPSRAALTAPEIALESLEGLVVIDEIQRMPGLFQTLRPLADRPGDPARFLVLGSASPSLVRGISESLAGRTLFIPVPGFTLDELGAEAQNRLWLRGGFPRSWLASSNAAGHRWRGAFITTFLERDIPQLGLRIPAETLRRFWTMLAHCHGRTWNGSELARAMDVSPKTAVYYRDILVGGYMVRILPPWFENLKKRQVKSPKVYIRDSGIRHSLLGVTDMASLRSHPGYGMSWEGFALEQVLALFGEEEAYFWGTLRGAELDLLLIRNGKRWGFEFKCSDAPTLTKSIHIALKDLSPESIFLVYPGTERYRLHEKVEAVPLVKCQRSLIFGKYGYSR